MVLFLIFNTLKMKYLILITALLTLVVTSCVKTNEPLPDNIFSSQEVEGLFEEVSLVYLKRTK
ncbi:MAG: hypothetical protein ACI85O_000210 [Saprospiraceae bacterium]|jgi:hypothetical protein